MRPVPRRTFLKAAAATAATGILALPRLGLGDPPGATGMNLMLLVAEDMGRHLGCYGDTHARTPNLDRLAGQGVRFENAYVTVASCSPSRATMLTGLYPQQNGQIGLSVSYSSREKLDAMKPGVQTLPQVLASNGYQTGALGKIHVEPVADIGFEYRRGSDEIGVSRQSLTEMPVIRENGRAGSSRVRYSADVEQMTRDAAEFFSLDTSRPFFLMVNFSDAHIPYYNQVNGYPAKMHKPEEFTEPFPFSGARTLDDSTRRSMAAYYNCIARLDASVGQILDALDRSGRAENTLVIFLSDHGPAGFSTSRGKLTNYESGLKVPFLLRHPRRKLPETFDGCISTIDILPTALDAANLPWSSALPGKSLLRVLDGRTGAHKDIYGDFNRHLDNRVWPIRSVRTGRYKLIYYPFAQLYRPLADLDPDQARSAGMAREYIEYASTPDYELFDLQQDPYEFHNLADRAEHRDAFDTCLRKLQQWQETVGDFLLDPLADQAQRDAARQNIRRVFGDLPEA